MVFRLMIILSVALMFINPAAAQTEQSIFERLEGVWTATGNSFGQQAQSKMVWSKTLNGKFYRIDYSILFDPSGTNAFTGIGHYKFSTEPKVTGYWVDNGGDLHPLSAATDADRLLTIWGKAGSKMGRTEYRLLPDDSLQVTDWQLTTEGWKMFNQAVFQKQPGGQ